MSNTGRLLPAEIVGGQVAPSPIPWQAAIFNGESYHCGATILDRFTVLSAAHCFQSTNSVDGFTIRAGSINKYFGGQVCILYYLWIHITTYTYHISLKS